jgi:hypothetical protein
MESGMSMCGCYRRVTVAELDRLLKDSSDIFTFLHPDDPADLLEDSFLDIDKTWAAIQFLLTRDVIGDQGKPPLSYAVRGGTWLGDVDVGYGPARYLLPEQVRALAEAMEAISDAELRKRFDMATLAEAGVYPGVWEDVEEELGYLLPQYASLQAFMAEAARTGDAMLLWIG